jgi:hypothetical protein
MRTKLVLAWFVLGGLIVSVSHAFTIGPSGSIGGTLQNAVIQNNHIFVGEWRNLRAYDLSASNLPPQVGSIELTGSESALATYDKFALLNTGDWLALVDLTNPTQMSETSRVAVPPPASYGSYTRIMVDGQHAFLLADNRMTMAIVDLTQPAAPAMVHAITYSNLIDVAVSSGRIYLLYTNLLKVFDYAQPTNLVELASTPLSFEGRNIVVQGPHAYIGTKTGLRIVNVSNPAALVELGTFSTKKGVMQTILQGGYVYLAVGESSLNQFVVADVSNPALPVGKYTNNVSISGPLNAFCVGGAYAAISADDNSMVIFDISNPAQIRQKSIMPFIGNAGNAWISERAIFVPAINGVLVYDLANPTHPAFAAQVDLGFGLQKIVTTGNRLYGWQSYSAFENSQWVDKSIITVADFTNLKAITRLGTFALTRKPSQMLANGTRLFLAGATNPVAGWLEIHDVTDPAAAIRLTDLPLTGTPMALFIDSNWLMVAVDNRVEVYDISTPTAPRLVGSANVSGAIATCLWAGNGQLLAGSIPQSMDFATNWWLDVFTVAANGTLTKTHSTNGSGAIWSVTKIQDTIFTGIMSGSTECYTIGPTGFQQVAVCHSPSTIGLTVVSPSGTGVGNVYSIEGYKYFYGEWHGYANYGIYIQTYDPRGEPPKKGVLITEVEPPEAADDGCTAEPALVQDLTLGTTVPVLATRVGAWNFVEWTGAAVGRSATTDAAITQEQNEAVAHFVKPVLTLSGKGESQAYPPVDTNLTHPVTIMGLTIAVSVDAGWTVTSIEFVSSGQNGNELTDLENVQLWKGSQFLGQSVYLEDNGRVTLPVNTFIPAGSSIQLELRYKFDTNRIALLPLPKEYRVETSVSRVQAVPTEPAYANFAKLPPEPIEGGPIMIAPVWNDTTMEGFPTIQSAIDDPDTEDFDIIYVSPGIYTENVKVNKGVVIRSFSGPDQTIVQANLPMESVFHLTQSGASVEGFTIRGASSLGTAGVQVGASSTANFIGKSSPSPADFSDIFVISNRVGQNDLGVKLMNVSGCRVESNLIIGNQSQGLTLIGGNSGVVRDNVISGNDGHGIGLYISATSYAIIGNLIGLRPDGTQAWPNNGNGIYADSTSSANTIGGTDLDDDNTISGNKLNGLLLESDDNLVLGNTIGLNLNASAPVPNSESGIVISGSSNVIGGSSASEPSGNLISANLMNGLELLPPATGNIIQGNIIGSDVTGVRDLGNGANGIIISNVALTVIGGSNSLARNIISGNESSGIHLVGPNTKGTQIMGNHIGCNQDGTASLPNQEHGIYLENAHSNIIGGAKGNLISGNIIHGVRLDNGASHNTIAGNLIGPDASGSNALRNRVGIYVENSPENVIGGTAGGTRNVISGNFAGIVIAGSGSDLNEVLGNYIGTDMEARTAVANGDGINIESGARSNRIGVAAANVISGNSGYGINLGSGSSHTVVQNNYLGVDVTGENRLPNTLGAIHIFDSTYNLIGGADASARNVISGNKGFGVILDNVGGPASFNDISGNYIGISTEGAILPNEYAGVRIERSGSNYVGRLSGNVISGNRSSGIDIFGSGSRGNQIKRNYIGLDKEGRSAIPNQASGIILSLGAENNTVGGVLPGEGNIISGNRGSGIVLAGSDTNWIWGNYIGSDASGLAAVPNEYGIYISSMFAEGNEIGSPQGPNVISGNTKAGVYIGSSQGKNRIQANLIGVAANGSSRLGNQEEGIRISVSKNNLIGGASTSYGNVIAFNQKGGVVVQTVGSMEPEGAVGNSILANRIFANESPGAPALGIDLIPLGSLYPTGAGVSGNDNGDYDDGGNKVQNYPWIGQALAESKIGTVIIGNLDTKPGSFLLQFFANQHPNSSGFGEGETFLGQKWVHTDSGGHIFFKFGHLTAVPEGQFITATATDAQGNTSEFSYARNVEAAKDSDFDGVPDLLELAGPNQGDANRDGIPDAQQSYVATVISDNDMFVNFTSPSGTTLTDMRSAPNPSPSNSPPRVSFPLGFFEFRIKDLGTRKIVQVEILLPAGITINSYYKYGRTADNPTPHWYPFLFDGTTGAEFLGNIVRLHFRDGWRGDDDLLENQDIPDIGGPAFEQPLRLFNVARLPDGAIRFQVEGTPEWEYQIEASSNLTDWQELFRTNTPAPSFEFLDTAAPAKNRQFYRASQSPGQ